MWKRRNLFFVVMCAVMAWSPDIVITDGFAASSLQGTASKKTNNAYKFRSASIKATPSTNYFASEIVKANEQRMAIAPFYNGPKAKKNTNYSKNPTYRDGKDGKDGRDGQDGYQVKLGVENDAIWWWWVNKDETYHSIPEKLIDFINLQGPQGPKGDTGETGPQGPQGEQGIQGPKGDKGDKGDAGEPGTPGAKGDTGETGPQGPKGDTGATGPQGPQGEQGIQGPKGDKGDKGDTGEPGTPGAKGDTGETGPQGPKGDTGETGPQGPQGEQGIQGPKGDKGDKGDTGEPGTPGAKGDTGETGPYFIPTVDENGNISWVNNGGLTNPTTQNIRGPQGPKGDKGDTGETGPIGPQGAQGEQGIQGPTGPAGQTGEQGPAGPTPIFKCIEDSNGVPVFNYTFDNGTTWTPVVDSKCVGDTGATGTCDCTSQMEEITKIINNMVYNIYCDSQNNLVFEHLDGSTHTINGIKCCTECAKTPTLDCINGYIYFNGANTGMQCSKRCYEENGQYCCGETECYSDPNTCKDKCY